MTSAQIGRFNKEEQRREKLDQILRVAAECFNKKGFSGTSLKDVSSKLGITEAAIYYYVKNKEELVNLCYLRATELAESALDRAESEGETALAVLQLYLRYQIEGMCGEHGPVAVRSEIPALSPTNKKEITRRSRKHSKRITELIERGIDEGCMHTLNPQVTNDFIMGALNWVPKWYRPDSKLTADEIASSFIETFTSGVRPR